ncbi:MAG: TIGR01212 family radical SAM protein, partial [Chitinivibrionales bacterium]|nr:TIGR01212 family radical SAM protein [Chitinivibrionales bacterium]
MSQLYRTYRSRVKERFGRPVLTVPINGGFSCPNRDGSLSTEGCAFCDNGAFSSVAGDLSPPAEQLARAIARTSGKFELFIAYLQPFTNTYASVERLREIYEPLIARAGVVGLAVGTRPDCLSESVVSYLADVASRTYLSVELGLQCGDDAVLARVNRGHDFACFGDACARLHRTGAEVVAHILLGLPGQTESSVEQTAVKLARLPVEGVKIHQLM